MAVKAQRSNALTPMVVTLPRSTLVSSSQPQNAFSGMAVRSSVTVTDCNAEQSKTYLPYSTFGSSTLVMLLWRSAPSSIFLRLSGKVTVFSAPVAVAVAGIMNAASAMVSVPSGMAYTASARPTG